MRALAEAERAQDGAQYVAEHAQDGARTAHDASWPGLEAVNAHARCEWPGLEAGSSKLRELVRLLREELPPDEKAVVFTRFPDALPLIGHVLQRAAIGTISLREDSWWRPEWKKASTAAGAVAGSALAAPVDTFRTDARCRVLLLDAGQSAAGLTLTCAQHVVFVDVLNSALLEEQAAARVARIGQTAKTTVWHLVARESCDVLLRDAADRKVALEAGVGRPEAIVTMLRQAARLATAALAKASTPAVESGLYPGQSIGGGL